ELPQANRERSQCEPRLELREHAGAVRKRCGQTNSWGKAEALQLRGGFSNSERCGAGAGTIQRTCEVIPEQQLFRASQRRKPHTSGLRTLGEVCSDPE